MAEQKMEIKELYETIKQKRDNAYDDLQRSNKGWCANLRLKGEIAAYNDVLSLIESYMVMKDE